MYTCNNLYTNILIEVPESLRCHNHSYRYRISTIGVLSFSVEIESERFEKGG